MVPPCSPFNSRVRALLPQGRVGIYIGPEILGCAEILKTAEDLQNDMHFHDNKAKNTEMWTDIQFVDTCILIPDRAHVLFRGPIPLSVGAESH